MNIQTQHIHILHHMCHTQRPYSHTHTHTHTPAELRCISHPLIEKMHFDKSSVILEVICILSILTVSSDTWKPAIEMHVKHILHPGPRSCGSRTPSGHAVLGCKRGDLGSATIQSPSSSGVLGPSCSTTILSGAWPPLSISRA